MAMRSGYVHALEGMIAALVVVFYLSSLISVPETTDWTRTRLSKTSEDVMSALDRSGFLDRAVMRDDPDSFAAFVQHLDSSLSYEIRLRDLPPANPRIAVLANNTSTFELSSSPGDWGGTGLPTTYSPYRKGNLSTSSRFGDVPFVLSDGTDDSVTEYTMVNFDFDDDGDFGSTIEGPHRLGERFECTAGVTGCSGHEYEVGPFNTTLRLYDASYASMLAERNPNVTLGRRTVRFTYDTVNPSFQQIDPFAAAIARNWTATGLDDYRSTLEAFIGDDRFLLVHAQVDRAAIDNDGNFLGDLGFDYIQQYEVAGSGSTTNVLYALHDATDPSYRSSTYYLDAPITVELEEDGGLLTGTVTIRGSDVGVEVDDAADVVRFSTDSYGTNYTTGDEVILNGNAYLVEGLTPLELGPVDQQRFDTFDTERINADYHLTRMENRTYNISAYDATGEADEETSDDTDPRLDGITSTPCNTTTYPYRFGNITVDGSDIRFLQMNFEPSSPCNDYYEYVYFDFSGDDDFNDDADATPSGYSDEGPHQVDDEIQVDTANYTVQPHPDGNGTDLERIGPRTIGEIPVSRNALGRGGSAAIIRRPTLGDDDIHLFATLLALESQRETRFTEPRSAGDVALGYTYTSMAGEKNKLPYTLDTLWWFR